MGEWRNEEPGGDAGFVTLIYTLLTIKLRH